MGDGTDNVYTVLGKPWVAVPLLVIVGGLVAHFFGATETMSALAKAWIGLVPDVPDITIGAE